MKIVPLFARVVVEPAEKESTTSFGIILAETMSKEKPQKGKVIAVGPDAKAVKAGDTVLFKKYSPTEIEIEDKTYFILDEEDLLGKME
ncbi:MAG: co-chaperone GroES [Candidatus Peregrinibacteria bacterium]